MEWSRTAWRPYLKSVSLSFQCQHVCVFVVEASMTMLTFQSWGFGFSPYSEPLWASVFYSTRLTETPWVDLIDGNLKKKPIVCVFVFSHLHIHIWKSMFKQFFFWHCWLTLFPLKPCWIKDLLLGKRKKVSIRRGIQM